jgi:hypothetical protein
MSISNIPPAATIPNPMPSAIAAVTPLLSSQRTSSFVRATCRISKSFASLAMPPSTEPELGSEICRNPLFMLYLFCRAGKEPRPTSIN